MSERPPLWTWAAAIGLAVSLLAALVMVMKYRDTAFFNLDRIEQRDRRPLIVAIGSSQTYCGLAFDAEMEGELFRRGLTARFIRISGSNMSLADLARFWKPVTAARPAILIVEANAVRFRRSIPPGWREDLRTRLERRMPWVVRAPAEMANNSRRGRTCESNMYQSATIAAYRAMTGNWRISSSADVQDFIVHVRALQAHGTRVMLFEMPRNPRFVPLFPAALRRGGDEVVRRVFMATGVGLIGDLPRLSPDQFADTGHLNASGQKLVSAWVADQLVRLSRRAP